MIFNKTVFLILSLILFISKVSADNKSYDFLLQKQAKQIQELRNRILELENTIYDIQSHLKQSGFIRQHSDEFHIPKQNNIVAKNIVEDSFQTDSNNISFGHEESAEEKEKSDYDLALSTLKEGNLKAAEKQFSDFITRYPSSKLQSNATFWYSESFYRQGFFDKAAINYLQSYKKHPTGNKAADALLKLAYSLASLNKNNDACIMLNKLESEFSNRTDDSKKRTKEAWEKFHCK